MNAPQPLRFWNAATTKLRCVAIATEAPDVKTFHFAAEDGAWFRYQPGQFVTFALPVPGNTVYRTYTLSSTPTRPLRASVTVKAQKDSIGTRWLLDHFQVGESLSAVGPAGDFTLPPNPEKLLFISGGSGVTPMLSMTRYLHDLAAEVDITYLHFARTPADLLFTSEIDALAGFWPALKPRFIVDDPACANWAGPVGRPSDALLRQLCPDLAGRDVFCCGPAPFMQAMREAVTTIAGSLDRYREESFQPAAPKPVESAVTTDSAEIRFTQSGRSASIGGTETILAAAQAAGIPIPYACEMGLCGTCQVKKISGDVVMNHDGGITDDAIAEGYILACCSRPASGTIEIDL
ncbi:2Fe-2S iron-sulfur cluster-binding protein [Dongia sp.]|uniref:2Fe-2S iron-sulfur cluster-binding protein n=1 Tax=Dongia sp. TaxID=1977262 RepID=UPI0035B2BCD6